MSQASTKLKAIDPSKPIERTRAWWHQHLEPEQRRRVMKDLSVSRVEYWIYRFAVMLTLSVIVAVMGLKLNSAAVVIGAMLLAPLMQPVLAIAACVSLALFVKSLKSLLRVTLATLWCIAIAYILSKIMPDEILTEEIISRTRPDSKDLVVALAAGAAGAYATIREDASASLPGVAVAVALVPPLGAIGVTLEAGQWDLAWGATLLYVTNLVAIVFASIVVFVSTGFVPPRRLLSNLKQVAVAVVIILGTIVLVGVPLVRASLASAEDVTNNELVSQIVRDELVSDTDEILDIDVSNERIKVNLRGTGEPPDDAALKERLRSQFGDRRVVVQWIRAEIATTTTTVIEPSEQLLAEATQIINQWLAEDDASNTLDGVRLESGDLQVEASGSGTPPSLDELIESLQFSLGDDINASLRWTQRETITVENASREFTAQKMRFAINQWAAERDVMVSHFDYDGSSVELDLAGVTEPEISVLSQELEQIAAKEITVNVYFTERSRLTTTTTTPRTTIDTDQTTTTA